MSTLKQSKVKTLSDQAEMRCAQWVDQAVKSRPEPTLGLADIDSKTKDARNAGAGAHSTETFLFDELQPAVDAASSKTSASIGKRRTGVRSASAMRDRDSARVQTQQAKQTGPKARSSAGNAAKTNVMTAELPFAILANTDDAALRKQRRQPNASPQRGTQASRRSSLPTYKLNSPISIPVQTGIETAKRFSPAPEWKDTWQSQQERALPSFDLPENTNNPGGKLQRLSQLLAKPEVGGYLVMGALIACTFLI